MEAKFKIGDRVRLVTNDWSANIFSGQGNLSKGSIVEISDVGTEILNQHITYGIKGAYCGDKTNWCDMEPNFELAKKGIPEDLTRYMVYGQGCNNSSSLLNTEKELREELNKKVKDTSWNGRIIGYKLVPLYEAETKTYLKSLVKKRKR